MSDQWDQSKLQQSINDKVEESLTLEYKAAGALEKINEKREEITKDVSAMANADGGILIYGIREYKEKSKRHLPEKLDPIDRTQYSKEWLEHIIGIIHPRIEGIVIRPIDLNTGPNHTAYVVEIPKSTTAHQAKDLRYYLRYNFESVPMEDYQIRDVMHRRTRPDVSISFKYRRKSADVQERWYYLRIFIKNHGDQIVNHYQIVFSIPDEISVSFENTNYRASKHIIITPRHAKGGYMITYRSTSVLFPEEEFEISQERDMKIQYRINEGTREKIMQHNLTLNWKLYADDMTVRDGQIPFEDLNDY